MRVRATRRIALVKGRGSLFQPVQTLAQVEEDLVRKAGSYFPGIDQALARIVIIADQQGPQSDARALRICEAADDELLPAKAFDLHPVRASRRDIKTLQMLGDDSLLTRLTRLLPEADSFLRLKLGPANAVRPPHRFAQQSLALFERESRYVVAIQIKEIEQENDSRILFPARLDLGCAFQVEPLLKQAEAGMPAFV